LINVQSQVLRKMARHLELDEHVEVKYSHQVLDFERLSNGKWQVKIKDLMLRIDQ
jgi:malate dehydrogenase (quinone)